MNTQVHSNHTNETTKDVLRVVAAIIFPPLGVGLQVGLTKHFWINLVLTLCFFVPGLIHSLYIILTRD